MLWSLPQSDEVATALPLLLGVVALMGFATGLEGGEGVQQIAFVVDR